MAKLLVPFDGSPGAMRALEHAMRQVGGAGEVVIVHAHEPPIVYGEVALYLPEARAAAMLRQHSEEVLRPALEAAARAGVRHTSAILTGHPAEVIVRHAEENGCDGIVMGTRGMGALGNLVLGSVATKIIHLTRLPVTLVR